MLDEIEFDGLFASLFRQQVKTQRFPSFGPGFWNGQPIEKLETSHLNNIVEMLRKREPHHDEQVMASRVEKIAEINREIMKRYSSGERIVQSRHKFVVTEEMILEIARQQGVKIPKSGAGVYICFKNGKDIRLQYGYVQVRFDTQKKLKGGKK